jgi:hypothetical protein
MKKHAENAPVFSGKITMSDFSVIWPKDLDQWRKARNPAESLSLQ